MATNFDGKRQNIDVSFCNTSGIYPSISPEITRIPETQRSNWPADEESNFEDGQRFSGSTDNDSVPEEIINSILSDLDSGNSSIYNFVPNPQSTPLANNSGKAKKSLEHLLDQSVDLPLTLLLTPPTKSSEPQLPNTTETESSNAPSLKKKFSCDACDKQYSRKDHLTRHVKSIHKSENLPTCEQCQRKFRYPSELRQKKLIICLA